jgi:hypothetical protein
MPGHFEIPDLDASGWVQALPPDENGRYLTEIKLVSPVEGKASLVNFSPEQQIDSLREQRLAVGVRHIIETVKRREEIRSYRQVGQ